MPINFRLISEGIPFIAVTVGFEAYVYSDSADLSIPFGGASSGVRGGLQQYCFLVAWILLFDYVLQFTLYTAVLCFKRESTRINCLADLRKVLEEDCIDHGVAKNVVSSSGKGNANILDQKAKSASVRSLKVLIFGGLMSINLLN
ncbi:3-hydroxy-3-methylglutaryl-coenzyme A (HMG-CoA) reductase isozyme [Aspergillus alliaceus]|uniref:3-hydroxy-3-methylglutaryl-coenzyme A (HMG-CoA) reductase isozyme n=1 Tax=Petromyces alliaceus TaxID=209559 RepID=A0A8H5ZRD1_PETAA|nr:3-hydroxy-3-methylglutaryl-coenzyme A (HMG-CoA) reductase isozyme [Aspergillus burnettii]